ncbi:MAG TPA: NYN domain-containing protein [Ktedonobacteraceae bacterium]|nr:NYN domain-containing protein [Ktedonobacteraceae bacterium]
MEKCLECGHDLRPLAKFCPGCGTNLIVVVYEGLSAGENGSSQKDSASAPEGTVVVAVSPNEPVFVAIERLWRFLESGREEQNRQNLKVMRQIELTPMLRRRLSTMCLYAARGALECYVTKNQTVKPCTAEELPLAILLADYATRNGTGDFLIDAQKCLCQLNMLQDIHSEQFEPTVILQRARAQYKKWKQSGAIPWTELAVQVTAYLARQRHINKIVPLEAKGWVELFAGAASASGAARTALLNEARQHGFIADEQSEEVKLGQGEVIAAQAVPGPGVQNTDGGGAEDDRQQAATDVVADSDGPLGFLNEEERARLLDHIRKLRFDQIRMLLRKKRKPLLDALGAALADPAFDEILPPRRSVPLIYNKIDLFPEVKKLMNLEEDKQRKALYLLEQAAKEITDLERGPIVREWLLYVRASVHGLTRSVPSWQEDYKLGRASAEEIWNLAVASRRGNVLQALEVLMPGVKSQHAPFSHLRFALACAVTLLQSAESYAKTTVSTIGTFLLDNLSKLPLPECYLCWLLLANDAPEPVAYNKQLDIINVFQDILERPIKLLRPASSSGEISIEDFERDFQGLLSIVQRLEADYEIEPQEGSIKIKSKLLATFVHTAQIAPKRVGIFIDYENLYLSLPPAMRDQHEMIARTLIQHISRYGEVVCRWVCAPQAHIDDYPGVMHAFEAAGFKFEFPRGTTGNLHPEKKQADFVLIECIVTEMTNSKPDLYIIVSGDQDFYERVHRLIEKGHSVCVIGLSKKLSNRYRRLRDRIQKTLLPEEYGKLHIDKLEDIFGFTPDQVPDEERKENVSR